MENDNKSNKLIYKVILAQHLSVNEEERYIVVNPETGEVLDDAQGYGYKSRQKAHAGYAYKTSDRSKKDEKKAKKSIVQKWCHENKQFVRDLSNEAYYMLEDGEKDKFNAKFVAEALKEAGFTDLPFTAAELLKYW